MSQFVIIESPRKDSETPLNHPMEELKLRALRDIAAKYWDQTINLGLTGSENLETTKRVHLFNSIRVPATALILCYGILNLAMGATAAGLIDLITACVGLSTIFGPLRNHYKISRFIAYSSFGFLVIAKKIVYGDSIYTHFHVFSMLAGLILFYEDTHPATKWAPFVVTATALTFILFGGNFFSPITYPVPNDIAFTADFISCAVFITLSFKFLKRENKRAMDQVLRDHQVLNRLNIELTQAKKSLEDQAQKIVHQSKMTAIGEMGAGLAHEINNPLTVSMGNLQLLAAEIERPEASKERLSKFTVTAIEHCKRIQSIVKALRHYSIDWEDSTPEDCDIQDIIRDTTALMSSRFREGGTDILVSIGMDPIIVYGRPAHLSQAILALLFNAFEAIKDLEDRWINIVVESSSEATEIRVIDSGPGIPEPVRSRLMQPFFTTKEVGQGKGLGLSTARAIIHQHQGSLLYDPECANTCFVIKLPLKNASSSLAVG